MNGVGARSVPAGAMTEIGTSPAEPAGVTALTSVGDGENGCGSGKPIGEARRTHRAVSCQRLAARAPYIATPYVLGYSKRSLLTKLFFGIVIQYFNILNTIIRVISNIFPTIWEMKCAI